MCIRDRHKAVYNMAEVAEIQLPYLESDAKNLFIRDDKKCNYYLITVKGNKRVDLKAFRKQNDTRPLTFASDQDLMDMLEMCIRDRWYIINRYNKSHDDTIDESAVMLFLCDEQRGNLTKEQRAFAKEKKAEVHSSFSLSVFELILYQVMYSLHLEMCIRDSLKDC